uniref:Uncharacterized protein n=1 Tax=Tetranychus urticae TaxID=32264 RepID=T1L178_TETUR
MIAVSASSSNKQSCIDDIQNNTQNAFHAFEQLVQTFNEKVQEALKNLFSNSSAEASVSVSKRATNPHLLIYDLSDPAKFAQTFLKVLLDLATGQGRRKRDIFENLQKALKKLFDLFEQLKPQSSKSTEAPVVVEKRATNPLVLINDLSDPAKFAQDFLKVLADMATGQGRRKRDVAEDFKKLCGINFSPQCELEVVVNNLHILRLIFHYCWAALLRLNAQSLLIIFAIVQCMMLNT